MPRIITQNGYAIGYEEAGSDEAMPIVFLHGVGSDKSVWRRQLRFFGPVRRAVAFDYPGYGDSDPAPAGTTRDDYASALISGMDELGIARAHVCGLSLGGVAAIALHHADPKRCASLILADSFAAHPDGAAIYERSMAASNDLRAMAEARVDTLLGQPADPSVRQEVVETMARIDPAAYRIGAEAVWLADQADRAAAIRVPTLVLCGSEDKVTPPELSIALADLIPGARLEIIAGAGHISNLEQPGRFNEVVEEFIQSLA
ncbi:MAG TPA: alpha/beta fold hydrolase [Sphingomicrobium sp.]|nr:alpha/beta fold hydrolase [Sphingomicrobium sp.]